MDVNGPNQPSRPDDPRVGKTPSPNSIHEVKNLTNSTTTSNVKVSATYRRYQVRYNRFEGKRKQVETIYQNFRKRFSKPSQLKKEKAKTLKGVILRNKARIKKMDNGSEKTKLMLMTKKNLTILKRLEKEVTEETKIVKEVNQLGHRYRTQMKKAARMMQIFAPKIQQN